MGVCKMNGYAMMVSSLVTIALLGVGKSAAVGRHQGAASIPRGCRDRSRKPERVYFAISIRSNPGSKDPRGDIEG
jgi:hypothetical protein